MSSNNVNTQPSNNVSNNASNKDYKVLHSISWYQPLVEKDKSTFIFIENSKDQMNLNMFKSWRAEFNSAKFIFSDDGSFKVKREVEKMSKSKYNVINPDEICFKSHSCFLCNSNSLNPLTNIEAMLFTKLTYNF